MNQKEFVDRWRKIINPDSKELDDEIEYYVGFINDVVNYHAVGDNYEGVAIQNSEDALDIVCFKPTTAVKKFTQKEFYDLYKIDISKYY